MQKMAMQAFSRRELPRFGLPLGMMAVVTNGIIRAGEEQCVLTGVMLRKEKGLTSVGRCGLSDCGRS
jgi:hypothetical protein